MYRSGASNIITGAMLEADVCCHLKSVAMCYNAPPMPLLTFNETVELLQMLT